MLDTRESSNTGRGTVVPWPLISARNALALAGILAALLVVGSAWDLSISDALYDQSNPVGIFGAAYGEVPAGMALIASGTLLILFRNPTRPAVAVGQVVGGGFTYLLGAVLILFLPTMYLSWPLPLVLLVSAVVVVATTWGVVVLARGAYRRNAIRLGVVFLIVVVAELVLINVIKIGWERPRMRMITEVDGAGFMAWWQPGYGPKSELLAAGVESEEFKSFPSGHTANAAVALLLTGLPVLRATIHRISGRLFWAGAIWALYVAFSRVIMGAHFVSDTVVGLTVTFVVILVIYKFAFAPSRAQDSPPLHRKVSS